MVPKICSIPECGKPSRKRSWCNSHYMNWFRHGDPTVAAKIPTIEEQFWARVQKAETCWLWTGVINDGGYGIFSVNGKRTRAHRFSWELANSEIPEGMQVDHRCRNRECVNPAHLRVVTNKQNAEHVEGWAHSSNKFRGVTFDRRRNVWRAQVTHGGKNHFGGDFDSASEAAKAAQALRNRLFTHNDLDRVKI